mmetsp:Transcript_70942/g.205646  ORF Transcript_70942/g.205646 Transcript_70942/m.205646 type:complete len:296 (+) Transcript_70942:270-1157(+)
MRPTLWANFAQLRPWLRDGLAETSSCFPCGPRAVASQAQPNRSRRHARPYQRGHSGHRNRCPRVFRDHRDSHPWRKDPLRHGTRPPGRKTQSPCRAPGRPSAGPPGSTRYFAAWRPRGNRRSRSWASPDLRNRKAPGPCPAKSSAIRCLLRGHNQAAGLPKLGSRGGAVRASPPPMATPAMTPGNLATAAGAVRHWRKHQVGRGLPRSNFSEPRRLAFHCPPDRHRKSRPSPGGHPHSSERLGSRFARRAPALPQIRPASRAWKGLVSGVEHTGGSAATVRRDCRSTKAPADCAN